MRYAVISDLHANIEALRAVFEEIDRDGIDQVVCLGDLVGYHTSANECIELVRRRGVRAIAGNHDRAVLGEKDTARFGALARRAIEWTRPRLSPENREYLAGLPLSLAVDGRFFVVHGALHPQPNEDLHLSNDARVARSLEQLASGRFGARVCFFGHTHRPVVYEWIDGTVARVHGPNVRLFPENHYLINPGSVGQSRDRDLRAAYAVFDAARATVELRRVVYDWQTEQARTARAGLVDDEPAWSRSLDRLRARVDRGRDLLQARLTRPAR